MSIRGTLCALTGGTYMAVSYTHLDLYWHKKIKEDPTIKFTVAPSFRPDKAININKPCLLYTSHSLCSVCSGCCYYFQKLEQQPEQTEHKE